MLAITIGFASSKNHEEPVLLYLGRSGADAKAALLNPPAGIGHTRLYLNPMHTRARSHSGEAAAPLELVEEVSAPEPPLEETPAPESPADLPLDSSTDTPSAPVEKPAGLGGVLSKGKPGK